MMGVGIRVLAPANSGDSVVLIFICMVISFCIQKLNHVQCNVKSDRTHCRPATIQQLMDKEVGRSHEHGRSPRAVFAIK